MVNNGVAKIDDSFSELNIIVPAQKNWFILLFSVVWLFGWVFGFTTVLGGAFNNDMQKNGVDSFMIIWLCGWTFGGLMVLVNLFWSFFGREKLLISNNLARFEKTVFDLGQKKKFETAELKNFRFEQVDTELNNKKMFWNFKSGKIKFDYGFKTYAFGLALDDAEANHIVDLLKKRFKV